MLRRGNALSSDAKPQLERRKMRSWRAKIRSATFPTFHKIGRKHHKIMHRNCFMIDERSKVQIYSDGACSGNPGPGGWGAVLISGNHRKEINGGEKLTTNNRMELKGAISALEVLKKKSDVDLYTDSNYVRNGIMAWIHGWKKNGWKTADKKPVKNAELWHELDTLRTKHNVTWYWLKGHTGHPENERADELARLAALAAPLKGRGVVKLPAEV